LGKDIGVWLVGARGSIACVTIAGHAAIARELLPATGLVTERPELAKVPFVPVQSFVFGGHEVRNGTLMEHASAVLRGCGLPLLAPAVQDAIEAVDARIRPGVVRGGGKEIEALGAQICRADTDAEAARLIAADLKAFAQSTGVERVIVVNLASTEPSAEPQPAWADLASLQAAMEGRASILPPSALYAYAALDAGYGYVNFTPSLGSRVPALAELAALRGAVHCGADGKTGETLVKSVLGELFVRRNLAVRSWFGQNILGNEDGRVLDNPENKVTKIRSKDHLLAKILGYPTESRVGIDYVPSLGEWKVAWDHIHFEGFLGGMMKLQFTWDGCDSLLAAPLVLDLARFAELALRRGESGVMTALAPFFKDPMGTDEQRLVAQDEALLAWALGT
jgi:myo-inositol-1-phosphate synthase